MLNDKILIIGNYHKDVSAAVFLRKFTLVISNISSDVAIISGDDPRCDKNRDIRWWETNHELKLLKFPLNIMYNAFIQLHIMLILLKMNKHDIVFVLSSSMLLPAIFCRYVWRSTIVSFAAQKPSSKVGDAVMWLCFSISHIIIAESNYVIDGLSIGAFREKIVNGALFVDTFTFFPFKKPSMRNDVIGFIGALEDRKGILNLIRAVRELTNVTVLVAGHGSYEESVVEACKRYPHIKFLGSVHNSNLPEIYNSIKLFVLPSYSEGVPNVLIEAMSCGTPVLASKVGGIPELIRDEETGFFLPRNDAFSIATSIENIMALGSEQLDEVGGNARKLIMEQFSLECCEERYRYIINLAREKSVNVCH